MDTEWRRHQIYERQEQEYLMASLQVHDALRDLWNALDSDIHPVVDEHGWQAENGQLRHVTGTRVWIYVDDVDGFTLYDDADARRLIERKNS